MPLGPSYADVAPKSNSPLCLPGAGTVFVLVTGLFFLWGIPNNLNDAWIVEFPSIIFSKGFAASLNVRA